MKKNGVNVAAAIKPDGTVLCLAVSIYVYVRVYVHVHVYVQGLHVCTYVCI